MLLLVAIEIGSVFLFFSLVIATQIKGNNIQFNFNIYLTHNSYIKMTNNTEEVCRLENWTRHVSMNEVNLEQQLLLKDPYDSIWLKIVAVLSYFIGLTNSAIMLAFINYENGHHGNFRTVINQLLSNLYASVSFYS